MRSLVLCQSCKRHVKGSDAQCPFCGTTVVAASAEGRARIDAPGRQAVPRGRGVPGGRAALFLAGSVLGPGCAEEASIPVYGVPIDGGQADPDAAQDGGPDADEFMGSPVYGVAIDSGIPIPADAGADAAATDAGCPRFGDLPAPVYGIPVDSGTRNDVCTDAGRDAGVIAVPPYGVGLDR